MAQNLHPIIHKLQQHSAALQDLSDLLTAAGGIDPNSKRTVHLLDILARDHAQTLIELSANLAVTDAL